MKNRKNNDQKKKDKQWSTKHYTENKRSSQTDNRGVNSGRVSSSCSTSGIISCHIHYQQTMLLLKMKSSNQKLKF